MVLQLKNAGIIIQKAESRQGQAGADGPSPVALVRLALAQPLGVHRHHEGSEAQCLRLPDPAQHNGPVLDDIELEQKVGVAGGGNLLLAARRHRGHDLHTYTNAQCQAAHVDMIILILAISQSSCYWRADQRISVAIVQGSAIGLRDN